MTRLKSFGPGLLVTLAVLCLVLPIASADEGPGHQAAQTRPILLGTSGGNINDISTLYCCSGTLGALVQDPAGIQYILSNNHVLAKSNLGTVGDPINQPGMIDQGCGQTGVVATLTQWGVLKFRAGRSRPNNDFDAAIAQVVDGAVRTDGAILDIGVLSQDILSPALNLGVQKSGRTTGHTTGIISAVDVTVDVGYSKDCGGAATQVARFTNQFRVSDGSFSAAGDSGSLIVENAASSPRAVGLLFAGSSSSTIGSPMAPILQAFGVSMVGSSDGTPPPPPPPPGPEPTSIVVESVTYATDGGKNGDKNLLITVSLVNDLGAPVAGAGVSIEVTRDGGAFGSASGTTTTAGTATFIARNAPNGTYSTTVTQVNAGTLTWDGATPSNEFIKGGTASSGNAGVANQAKLDRASAVKARASDKLFSVPGVVGHGVGLDSRGEPVVEVYLDNDTAASRAQIPADLEGIPVRVVATGPFLAF